MIESSKAPQRFDYVFDLPADTVLHKSGEGLLFLNKDGELLLAIAEPWASDAAGMPVPTYFEVHGNTVTQVVEHNSSHRYPIVADPWLGIQLYHNWVRYSTSGDLAYSAMPTPQILATVGLGGSIAGYPMWLSIMSGSGWDEWKAKWSAITNKASLVQQYNCHIAASHYGVFFTGAYNLERFRPNRQNGDWWSHVVSHRCNWTRSTGGE